MLIDEFMPAFDVRDRRERIVRSDPEKAYARLRSFDLYASPVIRAIFAIRAIPSRLRNRSAEGGPKPGKPFLDQALEIGWRILAEQPGRELVAGAVTQPWAADVRFVGMPPEEFFRFGKPGYTKIVWNLAVRSASPGNAILSTETRVVATDAAARRKFRLYWFFLSPGIRAIRWIALRHVEREIERSAKAARPS